jgi:glucose-6-phosphate 1-epimerase
MSVAKFEEVSPGRGGLPRITISTPAATAEIYLHGAHLTSWKPSGCEEVIFVSEQAQFADGKAIRGGIPVCFPWFREKLDDPRAPSHGFVRTKAWRLDSIAYNGDLATVILSTDSDESTLAWWPHAFTLVQRLTVGRTLTQELTMTNRGSTPLRFEEALHTYYRVGSADSVVISGLDGVTYRDNMDGNQEKQQHGDITFSQQTDRAYMETAHAIEIFDPVLRRKTRIEKENSRSTVVWNPWSTAAKPMSDLGDEEWRVMACVEASNMRACGVDLVAGAQHTMKVIVIVTDAV